MTEMEVTVSGLTMRLDTVGRTIRSVVGSCQVSRPQPQLHSSGARAGAARAPDEEAEGMVAVEEDDEIPTELRGATSAAGLNTGVASATTLDGPAVGSVLFSAPSETAVVSVRVGMLQMYTAGGFMVPCTMYPSTIDKMANLHRVVESEYTDPINNMETHAHGESIRRHLRDNSVLRRGGKEGTERVCDLLWCGLLKRFLLDHG